MEVVNYLAEHICDVNVRNKRGRTALHGASERGHTEMVAALLGHGCDVDAKDNEGQTALDLARNKKIVTLLKSAAEARRNHGFKRVRDEDEN